MSYHNIQNINISYLTKIDVNSNVKIFNKATADIDIT